jgi:hypothetical protein
MSGGGDIPPMSQKTADSGIARFHTESFSRTRIKRQTATRQDFCPSYADVDQAYDLA